MVWGTDSPTIHVQDRKISSDTEAANLGSIAQEAEQLVLEMNHVNQSVLDNISATIQALLSGVRVALWRLWFIIWRNLDG